MRKALPMRAWFLSTSADTRVVLAAAMAATSMLPAERSSAWEWTL